jgi:hypothetical protein
VQTVELGSKTLTLLTSVLSHGTAITQGVATRLLGDMVAKRLEYAGHKDVWEEFKHNPANHAPAERILEQVLQRDAAFRAQLESALIAAIRENGYNPEPHGAIHITGSDQVQIGDRGDTIQDSSRLATRGGTYNENARITNKTTNKSTGHPIGVLVTLAIIVLAIIIFVVARAASSNSGLSGNSTCQDFLNSSSAAQQAVIQRLATQYDKPDYVTPLGEPEVSYYCAANPSITLGQFFANAQD